VDQPGQHERLRRVISFGEVTQTMAEHKLRDHIRETQVDSPETFVEVTSPTTTFKQQAHWWLDEMRAGRIVSRKKRKPIKPATLAGYQAAVNWLNETIGNATLADIKNEVAKQLVIRMRAADLADKTIVNYFQVVKAVVASAVSREGEQLYPRNWNFHFIGLPVIDEKKQRKPSLTASEVEQILARAKGRYKVLLALLAGTGLRIGEALGLRLGEHLCGDFSTIRVRQSVWRGSVQTLKTDNAVREIDVPSSLAAFLKASVGGRTSGFLFYTESGGPLTQRNVLRDGLGKIRRDMRLEDGKAFPNCTPAKEPCAVGPAKAVAWSRQQGRHRPLCGAVERRCGVAQAGSREGWFGVQVADHRKFSWATWATKTAENEVEEGRLTD
jgi:integrase